MSGLTGTLALALGRSAGPARKQGGGALWHGLCPANGEAENTGICNSGSFTCHFKPL